MPSSTRLDAEYLSHSQARRSKKSEAIGPADRKRDF